MVRFSEGRQVQKEQRQAWLVVSRVAENDDLHHVKEEIVDGFAI